MSGRSRFATIVVMQQTELKERDRKHEANRVDAMRLGGRVAAAVKATCYHEPAFQIVFLIWCERKLRTEPEEAMPWARNAPRFIAAWQKHESDSEVWARFLVRAHVVHAIAERIAGRPDEALNAYSRATTALEAYRDVIPAGDVCDYYHHYGMYWAHLWCFVRAKIALQRAMQIAKECSLEGTTAALQDVARSHAFLGALYGQYGVPAGEAVKMLSAEEQREHRLQAAYHLGCAVRQLDVNANRYLADTSLVNLVAVTTFNKEPTERRAVLAQIEKARVEIRRRTESTSQFTCRLDWLQGLVHHSLGELDEAADLLRAARNLLIRKKADLLYLIITLDLAEVERTRGNWRTIRLMAKRLEPVIERCDGKGDPEVDHIRAWREAVLAHEVDDAKPWPVLDKLRSCLFNLPGLPS
ncbi:MAG: hypothetical protein AAF772_13530, partial [Acidobacteriota bacterium]